MTPVIIGNATLHHGDCREVLTTMPDQSVHCCVTSPPYFGLRDYGHDNQIGLEPTPEQFVAELVSVFRGVKRVLRDDGTLWLNLGDSYARTGGTDRSVSGTAVCGSTQNSIVQMPNRKQTAPSGLKPKDLIGIPWMVAFALRDDGWYLRQDIIWHKTNPMPESVTDRCTKAHEYIFLLSKSQKYFYDHIAIKIPGKNPADDIRRMNQQKSENKYMPTKMVNGLRPRGSSSDKERIDDGMANRRSVWTVSTKPFKGAHFATFPPNLIEPCILAGCPTGGTVLDPFNGAGTTGLVSVQNDRYYQGIDTNIEYLKMSVSRIGKAQQQQKLF